MDAPSKIGQLKIHVGGAVVAVVGAVSGAVAGAVGAAGAAAVAVGAAVVGAVSGAVGAGAVGAAAVGAAAVGAAVGGAVVAVVGAVGAVSGAVAGAVGAAAVGAAVAGASAVVGAGAVGGSGGAVAGGGGAGGGAVAGGGGAVCAADAAVGAIGAIGAAAVGAAAVADAGGGGAFGAAVGAAAVGAVAVGAVAVGGSGVGKVPQMVNSGWSIGRRNCQCLHRPCNFEANVHYSCSNHTICLSYQFSQGYSCSQPAFELYVPDISTLLALFRWLRLGTTQIVPMLNQVAHLLAVPPFVLGCLFSSSPQPTQASYFFYQSTYLSSFSFAKFLLPAFPCGSACPLTNSLAATLLFPLDPL